VTERRTSRIRHEIDEPGLRASIAADLNIVVSRSGASSSRQDVHIRQRRSDRAADPRSPENEEQS
jgi:hypothetical protein